MSLTSLPQYPVRDRLKNETRQEHVALEETLDLLRGDLTLADYGGVLAKFHAFHSAFDAYMQRHANHACAAAQFYCDGHLKTDWLVQDLSVLGVDAVADDTALPGLAALPDATEYRWGAVYVLEGSTLGGVVLCKHFGKAFGITPLNGLRFFAGYGEQTGEKWRTTLRFLRQCEASGHSPDRMVEGARRMFHLLQQHFGSTPLTDAANTPSLLRRHTA